MSKAADLKRQLYREQLKEARKGVKVRRNAKTIPEAEKCKAFDAIHWQCMDALRHFEREGYPPKDFEQWLFERAMEATLGKNVFDYWNRLYDIEVPERED